MAKIKNVFLDIYVCTLNTSTSVMSINLFRLFCVPGAVLQIMIEIYCVQLITKSVFLQ